MSVIETVAAREVARPGVGARVYAVLAALLSLLVIVQVFLAGSGVFTMARQLDADKSYSSAAWNNSAYWGLHFFNAIAIALVILLMLGASFLARLPGRTRRFTGILLGLFVLQAVLGLIPWPVPIAALHVLNAFAILAVALYLTRENWAFGGR